MNQILISYATYNRILYAWIITAVLIFILLLKVTAPYGRHSSAKWGPAISNQLGWVIMEVPVLLVLFYFVWPYRDQLQTASWVMIGLFCLHYINRTFIFPLRIHTRGKKMPLLIVVSGILFNLVNGFSLGYYFAHFANYADSWFTDIRFIAGLLLFSGGMVINWQADEKLIHLRKPGETHYTIPEGWLFKYISCPNLFGEIIEWMGYALLCWNLPAWVFFIWTSANLIPRALSHHKWYRHNFTGYPAQRKAVFPFLV